jgi:hypothetical protein
LLPLSPLRTARDSFDVRPLKPLKRPLRDAVILTFTILIWCYPKDLPFEGAPAGLVPAVICFPPLGQFARFSRDERPDESLPAFAWGDVALGLDPYPPHYKAAFASFIFPYPHIYRLALRFAFPFGRCMGLPRSVLGPLDGLGPACSPVARHLRQEKLQFLLLATCLLAQAFELVVLQHLWLVPFDDVYQRFTYVGPTITP